MLLKNYTINSTLRKVIMNLPTRKIKKNTKLKMCFLFHQLHVGLS